MNYQLEYETLQKELEIYKKINQTAMLSWWKINFTTSKYDCSDSLRMFYDFEDGEIPFEAFRSTIHPEHLERIVRNGQLFSFTGVYEEKFQIMTRYGYRWVCSKLGNKEIDSNGHTIAYGYLRFMDELEIELMAPDSVNDQIKNSLEKYKSITSSLIYLLHNSDTKNAINQILSDVMNLFCADRAYIFEYNSKHGIQNCTYEVTSSRIEPQIDTLKNIPLDETPWWTEQILNRTPIILNTVDELPEEAYQEKDILSQQDIKSLLVVPLTSDDNSFGYIGIDMVKEIRIWSNIDKEWLISLSNIISMCIKLKSAIDSSIKEHQRFNELYDNMPMGVMRLRLIYDKQGNPYDFLYLEANRQVEKITLVDANKFLGKTSRELKETLTESKLSFFNKIIKEKSVVSSTNHNIDNDKYVAFTAYPAGNDELVVIFHDNTDNVLMHRDLERNKIRLDNIFQNVPIGIEIYDKDGILVELNDADINIFGVKREDVVGKINLFQNPNVPEQYLENLRKGENINMEIKYSHSIINETNYYNTSLSGSKILSVKSSIIYNAAGDIENIILVIVDGTETKEVKNRLEEFELIFNSLAEFSAVGLCRYNTSTGKFIANDQWYNNICKDKNNTTNLYDAYSNINHQDRKLIEKNFDEMDHGTIDNFRMELQVYCEDGDKWLRSYYKVSKKDESTGETEFVGLNIDITELKNIEFNLIEAKTKAEESDRLKSAFVANMSHEIRTPLNAIVGFSEMLLETYDDTDRQQYMTIIKQNNDLLLTLISDILDISKIESGLITISRDDIDVNQLCNKVVESSMIKVNNNVEILFDNHIESCIISTDKLKLTQILTNFVSNAIKFTDNGSIKLGYNIDSEKIMFYVKDTGIGISESDIDSIFERFVKLNTFAQGSGLGLSICKSLAERLGGTISAESTHGQGSCFNLTLPLSVIKTSKRSIETTNNTKSKQKRTGRNLKPIILIAEDRDSNYMLISAILKNDYTLIHAWNGQEAVQIYKSKQPDIILMDMRMPIMSGEEAITEIRKGDKEIPIIAVTAFAFDQDKKRVMELGCNDYISKPINADTLKDVIIKLLNK